MAQASRSKSGSVVIALSVIAVGITLAPAADSFVSTGSMPSYREFHEGEILVSGKVLIAGGSSFSPGPGYLYDPVPGTFSSTGSMAVAPGRTGHTLTRLGSGKVLVAGGSDPFNGGVTLNSAQLYDPGTNGFTVTANLTGARRDHTATLLSDGRVLLAAGQQSFTNLQTVELYNPATGTFAATGSLAAARYAHVAAPLPGGKVLVAGGFGTGGVLASAEIYDPVVGTWSPTGGLATARYLAEAVALSDGRVLVVGGRGAGPSFSLVTQAEIYDPVTATFGPAGALAAGRLGHRAALLQDGRVLVVGGGESSGPTPVPANPSSELYTPASNSFAAGPAMIIPRLFHTATLLTDGRVLVVGGEQPNQILSSAELFVPTQPVGAGSIVINEIAYHPDDTSPDPLVSHEWVELYNKGGSDADLTGWKLGDRAGIGSALALPAGMLPAGAYLTVHHAAGTDDLDFSDGCGQYYTGDPAGTDLLGDLMDESVLYGVGGASDVIDFVAWNHGATGYVAGAAHVDAVAAGEWTLGEFLNTERLAHSPSEKWRSVAPGTTIGRNRASVDTNRPEDWDSDGGRDAVGWTACGANRGSQPLLVLDEGPGPPEKTWTVMLYMVGDNDLEKRAFYDLKEIERAGGSSASVNFVAMIDGGSILTQGTIDGQGNITLIPSTEGHTWRFQVGAHVDDRYVAMRTHGYDPYLGERNLGAPGELSGFIAWAKANYPAQKYALILWDHGHGWKSFGADENTKAGGPLDFLYMGELRDALDGHLFELLGFDACLMAMIEVADQVQPYARYMVASQERTEQTGWPYDAWVPLLRADPTMDGAQLGTRIVEEFDDFYRAAGPAGGPRDGLAALSCLDMAGIPALVAAVSAFASDLKLGADDFITHDTPGDNVEEQIRLKAAQAERFTDNNFMDLRHFALLIRDDSGIPLSPDQCYKANLPPVIAQTVNPGPVIVAEKHGTLNGGASGLSIHFPLVRTTNRDGSQTQPCEGDVDTYDCPSDSRLTDWPSRRAAYATNVDCLPYLAEDVERGDAIPAPAEWPMVPSPNLRFVLDTQWDELLQRFYHPVADNGIEKAICPDGREIYPIVVDPICGNPIDEITILPDCEVFFRAVGSSDADTTNRLARHWMWDFDHATSGCGACIAPYEVGSGALASSADDDMNAEHDCSKAPLTDEKQADAQLTSQVFTEFRDYIVTLHVWDDNHLFKRHDTNPDDDHVHPQTDDHPSIVHLCSESSPPLPVQGLRIDGNGILTWSADAASSAYDLVKGDLGTLGLTLGDFTTSLTGCVENDGGDLQAIDPFVPSGAGAGFYYLVRGVNGFGQPGTYDDGWPGGLAAPRDANIQASGAACP